MRTVVWSIATGLVASSLFANSAQAGPIPVLTPTPVESAADTDQATPIVEPPAPARLVPPPLLMASQASPNAHAQSSDADEPRPTSGVRVVQGDTISLLTDSAQPGLLSLLAIGALLCHLGARAIGVKR